MKSVGLYQKVQQKVLGTKNRHIVTYVAALSIGIFAYAGVTLMSKSSAQGYTMSEGELAALVELKLRQQALRNMAPPDSSATVAASAPSATKPSNTGSVAGAGQNKAASQPASGNPWSVKDLYVNPATDAARQAGQWAGSRPADAAIMARIAAQPQALWVGGWTANVAGEVGAYVGQAAATGKMPVVVVYNIPMRDCGSYSAGGAKTSAEYAAWVQSIVQAINGRPAVVILEPDALPQLTSCLDQAGQQERLKMLASAVASLKSRSGTYVYIDAGNSGWLSAAVMAPRLQQAGIAAADGFALNVSNFYTSKESASYGTTLSGLVGNKHFVIDTGRNGRGALSGEAWCNPSGRALGMSPTAAPGLGPLVDAVLWIKTPGQSDGTCNGGPAAGVWWPDYALGLARAAGW